MPEQQFHQFHNNHHTAQYKYDKYYKKYIIPFCTYKNPIWINCGLCSMIIFLVIAIITFTLGCNPNIKNTCMNYYIVDITIEKYGMHNDTCNTAYCHVPSPNGIGCLVFFTAPCYKPYVIASFIHNNNSYTCELNGDFNYVSIWSYTKSFENIMNQYKLNTTYETYVQKNTFLCINQSKLKILANVGITFFILALTALLFTLIMLNMRYSTTQPTISEQINQMRNDYRSNQQSKQNNILPTGSVQNNILPTESEQI
jgi:hypothetical protein